MGSDIYTLTWHGLGCMDGSELGETVGKELGAPEGIEVGLPVGASDGFALYSVCS